MTPDEHDDLPLLTDVIEEGEPALPILTEVVAQVSPVNLDSTASFLARDRQISELEMQRVMEHFTDRLEAILSDKISHYLEGLQRQAVKLAILDLKSELPELLRLSIAEQDTPHNPN
ncbi:MAG: hypothetical protein WCD45_04375 [Gallionella sp.]